MNRYLQTALRAAGALTAAGSLVLTAVCLPSVLQHGWGEALAVLTASLMQPQQSLQALTEEWRREPAHVGNTESRHGSVAPPAKTDTEDQSPKPSVDAEVIPPKGDGGGTVVEEQVGGGTALSDTVYMKNTSGVDADWAAYLERDAGITFTDTELPQVLIVHTHTTESYMTYYAGYYNDGDCIRTTDAEHNVCVVGEVLANRLRAAGIHVIHDMTVHDYPQYTGAYSRSEETVRSILAQYPSIRLVLDLHRDALQRDDTTKVKPTVTVQGKKAAQMMIIASAGSDSEAPNPYWETNVTLGVQLQKYLCDTYSGLMRPISFTESRYNQHLLPGSLLVEMGGDANTFTEAIHAAGLLGDAIIKVLKG